MKIFLIVTFLMSSIFSQEVLVMKSGKKYEGEFLGIKNTVVFFLPEEKKKEYKYFTKNIELVHLLKHKGITIISDGKIAISDELKPIYTLNLGRRSFKLNPEFISKEKKEVCEKNSKISIVMLPLSKDYYGFSEFVQNAFDSVCYDIKNNIQALEFLDQKNISMENVNEYHLSEIGKNYNVDYLSHGYAYRLELPNKSSQTSSATGLAASSLWGSGDLTSLIESLPSAVSHYNSVKTQNKIAEKAGTYLAVTFYLYDIKTGKKRFIYQNTIIKKLI